MPRPINHRYRTTEAGCWIWTGALDAQGYGLHRMMYERYNGPVPVGLEIDHVCRVRACVNPEHLEAVTHQENMRRGNGWAGINARKMHCKRGHELTEDNIYRYPSAPNLRHCLKCRPILRAREMSLR